MKIATNKTNQPIWKDVYSHSFLPKELAPLEELATNLWWVWNHEGAKLFGKIDPVAWKDTEGNPVQLLQRLSHTRIEEILADKKLMEEMHHVYEKFRAYIDAAPDKERPSVAYFSMEYGLTNVLKIYSGGLGILAGDYLKQASDSNVDMVGVGFLYRYGYFTQSLSIEGQQVANYEAQNFMSLSINQVMNTDGTPMILEVPFPGRIVYTNVWRVDVGRIPLYLMDTDIPQNSDWDRSITHQLYGGDWENRMKQEYLLGIGGVYLLNKLGIKKDVYHCNEGHAALINAQRLVDYIQNEHMTFSQALEVVRSSSLYTCHTPVPAGHDYFDEDLLGRYMGEFPAKLGISWQEFVDMGRENPGSQERFCMSFFALNTSQEANGVSYLHGIVSRKMFAPMWKGYFPEELHVSYVTNGVHMPTWAATEWKRYYNKIFKKSFFTDQSNTNLWKEILHTPDEEIWDIRKTLKHKLIDYIKVQYKDNWLKNQMEPSKVVSLLEKFDPNALLIGFGRRFATYKRAHLLFTDLERLNKIVNNEKYPVQFVFTGKAHPADGGGQGLIKHIVEISKRPEFLGKIIFLENYDMRLARRLISGVDVWLNTPTRPLEASGTSGEKAEMNGVLNFSVLDGWWYEGYKEGAGWALTDKRTYDNQQYQDQLDAATIYHMLEDEIIPLYFDRNGKDYPEGWIKYIKKSISEIAPNYTMKRMIDDYFDKFYNKLAKRSKLLSANNYAEAKEIAAWKAEMAEHWDNFVIESVTYDENLKKGETMVGKPCSIQIVIDRKGMKGELGVDLVLANKLTDSNELQFQNSIAFELEKTEGSRMFFKLDAVINESGNKSIGLRVYPHNPKLPHRMDFAYVRWI